MSRLRISIPNRIRATPRSPEDAATILLATPEGDGEYPPDVPLEPAPEGLQRPRLSHTNKR